MLSAGRHVDDIDLCDLIKDDVLPFHMSWTSLIDPLFTSKAELEALLFSRGVHLESKELVFRQYDKKTEPTAFVANGANDDMESMREQLASLTARFNGKNGRNGRGGRGGGRTSTPTDHNTEARTCYECGKPGHVRLNCPELPRNKKRHDNAEGHTDHTDILTYCRVSRCLRGLLSSGIRCLYLCLNVNIF